MSDEQLKAFLAAIKADPQLKESLKTLANFDELAALARDLGFVVSVEGLRNQVLTDQELEGVAGGTGDASSCMYPTRCADHRCQ